MVIILMGVSGAGKTTIGLQLAATLGWPFYDGDDFHPPANVEKMALGIALTDDDRFPWLDVLHALLHKLTAQGAHAVLACSALKDTYRQRLLRGEVDAQLVYLQGSYDLIRQRLEARQSHFMPADLLASQFVALEEPKDTLVIEIDQTTDEIVRQIHNTLVP